MPELMRNYLSPATIKDLARRISSRAHPLFNVPGFQSYILPKLAERGLTERIELIADGLEKFLPDDFPQSSKILTSSLGPELDDNADDPLSKDYSGSQGFVVIALTTYIARKGKAHFELTMEALKEMTKRFSSESSVRDFILWDEKKVLSLYHKWASDPNVHVRRLVSESTRPRLPWAKRLPRFIQDPTPVIKLLTKLKDDKHLYVRRSVANNLNDISKDNPGIVIETLKDWGRKSGPELTWLTKHALRTLIKKGNHSALQLVGVSHKTYVTLGAMRLQPAKIKFGNVLELSITLTSASLAPEPVLVDYIVWYQKANGKLAPKVFKWTRGMVSKENPLSLSKKHPLRAITTRKYYPGQHQVEIQVNGNIVGAKSFQLLM